MTASAGAPAHYCPLCRREFAYVNGIEDHDCLANIEYDREYREQKTAAAQVMREMRTRLGDPDPDDPTRVHSRRIDE